MNLDEPAVFMVDFGVDAVVGGVATTGLFDREYRETFGVGGVSPSLLVAAPIAVDQGTTVVIGSRHYVVAAVELESEIFNRLRLEAEAA